jgi:hypothetical protein
VTQVPHAGRQWPALALTALILGLLSGCGQAAPTGISASSVRTLRTDVQTIRLSASRHNAGQARAAVTALHDEISRLVTGGELNRADARVLEADANQVDARVTAEVKPVSTAPAITTTSTAPTPPAGPPAGHGKGPGGGKVKKKDQGKGGKGGGH